MTSQQTTTQPRVTLYWLNDSRAQRFVWLLEELGLPYDVEIFQRTPDMFAPPELEKIHPLGKAPLLRITFPDSPDATKNKDVVLAESGFIAQYLTEHFGQAKSLSPKRYRDGQEGQAGGETDEWMRYQYFLHYAEGSLMPPLLVSIILSILKSPRIPFFIRPITSSVADKLSAAFLAPEMAKHLAFLESQLETSPGGGSYLCGAHLTTADMLMSFPLQMARERVGGLSAGNGKGTLAEAYPKLWAYLKRLEEEPAYKRAEAKVKELEKKD
ncbi:glutathione S-transferase [Chaetomidium leptoderma]|uniref:Glutathione S-transferase n=1 Tax=Chaetomidium leptoderma TaxID=669021 RepID=A0AAN6VG59_9PEZI|nr:glutathione S-transferase [Chaetomidium leptoderma]